MDIIERLNEVVTAENQIAQSMDMDPKDTANHRHATTCREAIEEIKRLRAALEKIAGKDGPSPLGVAGFDSDALVSSAPTGTPPREPSGTYAIIPTTDRK